jgi:hypothetical protein
VAGDWCSKLLRDEPADFYLKVELIANRSSGRWAS